MSRPSLSLTYAAEDEWSGELTLAVECEGFAGSGSAWFNRSGIEQFLSQIAPCPITEEIVLAGGYFDIAGTLVREMLGVRIFVHDTHGNLGVRVHVSTDSHQDLTACFTANYAELAEFRISLAAVLHGQSGTAVLSGRL